MRVGDKIFCHTSCVVGTSYVSLSKNKTYTIIEVNDFSFLVLDNYKQYHQLSFFKYKEWLMTEKEYRKLKLKKINESR